MKINQLKKWCSINCLRNIKKQVIEFFYKNKEHLIRAAVLLTVPILGLVGMVVIWLDTPTIDKQYIPMIIISSILLGVIITLIIGYVVLRIFLQKLQDEET